MSGAFETFVNQKTDNKSATKPVTNNFDLRNYVSTDKSGKIIIPKYVNPATLDQSTQPKLSQDTGKSLPGDIFGNPIIPKKQGMFSQLVSDIAGGFSDAAKFVIQAPARFGASTTVPLGTKYTPQGNFQKFVMGEEPISPIQEEYGQAKQTLQSGGYGKASSPLAGLAVFGGGALNFLGAEGGEEGLAKTLLKETDPSEVANILSKIGVSEDLIKPYAERFANAKTADEIKTGIESLKNVEGSSANKVASFGSNTKSIDSLISHEGAPDLATVEKYKADIQAGKSIEPLKVIDEGSGKFGIEDGKHRFEAYKQLGYKDIPTETVSSRGVSSLDRNLNTGAEALRPNIGPGETKQSVSKLVKNGESSLSNGAILEPKSKVEFNITGGTPKEKIQSAITNSERIKNELNIRGKSAMAMGQKLSPADIKLAEQYEQGKSIASLAKQSKDPAKFTSFMNKLTDYYDFRLAADRAAGGETKMVENYIPHNWDLSKPEDLSKFNEYARQRGLKPYDGFRAQPRVFNSYAEGEALGFKRANPTILEDLQKDYQGSSSAISKQVLKQGLKKSAPESVSISGKGLTKEGKPFVNSNIPGLEGISYHPNVDKLLKGYEPLSNTDIFSVMKDKGFNIKSPNTYGKMWEAVKESGAINTVTSLYDRANSSLKRFLLNFSGFHSINVSANFAGASIFEKPLTGVKGLAESVPSFFSESTTQKVIDKFSTKLVKGQDFSIMDAGLRAGVNLDRGLPAKGLAKLNPMTALSQAMFDRELYTLKLNLVDQVFGNGKVLPESAQGRALGKEINQIMGEMNGRTMNINPNTQKWFNRVLLAPEFTESKYATIGKALSTNPTKSIALKSVMGKSIVMGTLATLGTLIATGKFPNLSQVLLNYTVSPDIQTNITNPRGQKQDLALPQTFISEPIKPSLGVAAGIGLPIGNAKLDDLTHYATARLAPALSDAISLYANKDYYGKPIVDPNSSESALTQILKNIGAGDLPIGVQALVNFKEGKITAAQAATTIIGLRTKTNANDPKQMGYAAIDDAKTAISKISGSDPQRVEKMQEIFNSLPPDQRKSLAYQELLAGVKTKGVYISETERKYFQVQDLVKQGKMDEAAAITKAMTPEEYKTYKSIKTRLAHEATYNQISGLLRQGKIDEATALTSKMSAQEYKSYKTWKIKNP